MDFFTVKEKSLKMIKVFEQTLSIAQLFLGSSFSNKTEEKDMAKSCCNSSRHKGSELLWKADGSGANSFHLSIFSGNLYLVKWILSVDVTLLHSETRFGFSPLHVACALGQLEIVQWLLLQDAGLLRITNANGDNAFQVTIIKGGV